MSEEFENETHRMFTSTMGTELASVIKVEWQKDEDKRLSKSNRYERA